MMNIRTVVSATLLAAGGVAGALPAFAGQDATATPTDLYIAIWNTSTNTSVVEDLGTVGGGPATFSSLTSTSAFANPAGFTTSWNVDTAAVGTTGTLWTVFAADDSGTTNYVGESLLMGFNSSPASAPTLTNGALIDTGLVGTLNPYLVNKMTLPVNDFTGTTANGGYWALNPSNPGVLNGSFGINSYQGLGQAATGSSLLMIDYVGAGTDTAPSNTTHSFVGNKNAGVFTLNGSTLSYSVPAAVPLPAAAWLLISGLLGLGAVARRRVNAVAA